ncbi:MAG: aminotransferase class V-fold PLP-dependent enzyme [Gammaproteobacteria bacterium]
MLHEDLAKEFPHSEGLVYLNHAGVAPWPRRAVEAVQRFADENLVQGALDYARWLTTEAHVREQLRELINAASADDIALLKNTSEGLSFVANGIDWRPGDVIVSCDEEFPSNRIVWEALQASGVELRTVGMDGADLSPEEALIRACAARTRMLAVSSVQYASGLRLDLSVLGRFCATRGIVFCVDAIQSLGAFSMDVRASRIDIAVADAHKWLLGPEGIALFYVSPRIRERLALSEYGWHMRETHTDYDDPQWQPARSARRFECGSLNMIGIHALSASLSLLLEIGADAIQEKILRNTSLLIELFKNNIAFSMLNRRPLPYQSGIVSLCHPGIGAQTLCQRLRQQGVICAVRRGALRLSPHFYINNNQLERVYDLCEKL